MNAVFLAQGAIAKWELAALSQRSDRRGAVQLAGHLAGLAATGLLVAAARGSAWLLPAMAVHGVVLVFLFAPLHETIHRSVFRTRRYNDALAWVCGHLLLLPPRYFRSFHYAHHRYTQDPELDPELGMPKPRTLASYLWYVGGIPQAYERITTLIRHARGQVDEAFIAPHRRGAITREARHALALYGLVVAASLLLRSDAALIYWLVPSLLGQPVLRLFLLVEHTDLAETRDMLENSRSLRTNAIVRALGWNMPHHAEHHACPAVPFHALPKLNRLLRDELRASTQGYWAVHREMLRKRIGSQ